MLSHVFIGITNFEQSFAFYAGLMEALGFQLKFSRPDVPWAGWMEVGRPRPLVLIGHPFDGKQAISGNGQMIALLAPSRAAVRACYSWATASGGRCEGEPGLRPDYHPDYYGAYFRDLDGNKLCVCCHDPAPGL